MSIFALEEIPYQNWLTTKNSVEKMRVFSTDLFSKIISIYNEKLKNNSIDYNPWMISAVENIEFSPLANLNSSTKIVDSIEYLKLIKSVFKGFSKEKTECEKVERLLGVKFEEFDLETDANIIQSFSAIFNEALNILSKACPWIREMYDTLVHQVLFLKKEVTTIKAMSTHFLKGIIIFRISLDNSICNLIDLAVDIAHEVGHQALMVFLSRNKILSSSYDFPVYSGAKKTNRPAIKSLHSAVSLTYMSYCLEGILNNFPNIEEKLKGDILKKKLEFELNLKNNLNALLSNCEFTNFGAVLIKELSTKLKGDI